MTQLALGDPRGQPGHRRRRQHATHVGLVPEAVAEESSQPAGVAGVAGLM